MDLQTLFLYTMCSKDAKTKYVMEGEVYGRENIPEMVQEGGV